MPRKNALLFVKLNPPVNEESNFSYWYNEKHIPDRLNLPGFLSARRFTRIAGIPKKYAVSPEAEYLALYDLTDINVLRDVPYKALQEKERKLPLDSFETRIFGLDKFARGVYEHIYPEDEMYSITQAEFVFIVGHEVPRNRHQEFNAWYNTEHIPALLAVPGFQSVRRFRLNRRNIPPMTNKGGTLSTYLTLWDIGDDKALESDEFHQASQSPWTDWIRSWYTRTICALYCRVFSAERKVFC